MKLLCVLSSFRTTNISWMQFNWIFLRCVPIIRSYDVRGDIPIALGSGWPGWGGGTCCGPVSRFFNNWFSQCFVDLSSCRHVANVLSLNWSGKHCRNAKRALWKNEKKSKKTVEIFTNKSQKWSFFASIWNHQWIFLILLFCKLYFCSFIYFQLTERCRRASNNNEQRVWVA